MSEEKKKTYLILLKHFPHWLEKTCTNVTENSHLTLALHAVHISALHRSNRGHLSI